MLWLNFVFGPVYDNEFETKENKILTKNKTEPQHIHSAKWNKTIK